MGWITAGMGWPRFIRFGVLLTLTTCAFWPDHPVLFGLSMVISEVVVEVTVAWLPEAESEAAGEGA